MKRSLLLSSILFVMLFANAQPYEFDVKKNSDFALSLYHKLSSENTDNILFSPYSISTAMGMTYSGADGETQEQIARVFGFSENNKEFHQSFGKLQDEILSRGSKGVQIDIANRVWTDKQYKFRWGFLRKVKRAYGANIVRMPFRTEPENSRLKINDWVEQKTHGHIPNLLPERSITNLTAMVLTNAVYFNGHWAHQFSEENTMEQDFYAIHDKVVPVPMMRQKGEFRYYGDERVQILELPYAGDHYSMQIFLPGEDFPLYALERELRTETLERYSQMLKPTSVSISLPKFQFDSDFEMKNYLAGMGMPIAFTDDADFTRMSKKNDLKIDKVIHKAYISLSEEGTEAAAATAVVIVRKTSVMPLVEFNANRPFMFLIKDNQSGAILFMGRYTKPL